MIFGANVRIFYELLHRTFKTVIDSDYDYQNRGGTVIGRKIPIFGILCLVWWIGPLSGKSWAEGKVHFQCQRNKHCEQSQQDYRSQQGTHRSESHTSFALHLICSDGEGRA